METAKDVAAKLRDIYGEEPGTAAGVLHVTAAWEDEAGFLRALRICAQTPRSSTDAFILGVARARADVIVTTGASLRAEPGLRHTLDGVRRPGPVLESWRREFMGRDEPPVSCILTASGDLDFAHGLLRESRRTIVYTRPEAAAGLRARIEAAGLGARTELVVDERSSLAAAITHLRVRCGFRTVAIETGPTAAATLYATAKESGNVTVDELLLSRFEGNDLPDAVKGPALFPASRPAQTFARSSAPFECHEESGPWTFRRFLRQ